MDITPPVVEKKEKRLEMHDDVRTDPYFWLNEREDPAVIDYLQRENDYYKQMTAHTADLKETLYGEMKARIKEDDESAPYFYNGYYYVTRHEKGKDYPVYTRKKGSLDAEEEVLIDCNELAEGHSYFHLAGLNISPDNRLAAFGIDRVGRRSYTIRVKDLETGELFSEKLQGVTGGSVWANDNKTLFYARKDPVTLRADKICRHVLGGDPADDELVYHEEDDTFNTYVFKTKSRKFLIIGSSSTLTDEYRILESDNPVGEFRVFNKRERGMEHSIDHHKDGHFYILTNKDKAANFKLMEASEDQTTADNWKTVIGHREDTLLEGFDLFEDYLVTLERNNGLNKIYIQHWDGSDAYYLPFESETYMLHTAQNSVFETDTLRYVYNSLITPNSVIDFNMKTKEHAVIKEQEVPDGKFDKNNYEEKRIWATAGDGTKIPVSLIWRKGMKKDDGSNPVLQYGYGSYGITVDPRFSTNRFSLLDRGFVFAIAHIRGGEYMGRQWYEDGKLLKKKNTFTDFIDVSRHLIAEGYTTPDHLYAMGGSAGGLLMGAVMNTAPELYNGIVSAVPFVDVVTTMLDDSIPLTTGEYDEWGNPNEKEYYDYIKSYSPYDNVEAKGYPNILVTTGLHDSQVQYWEPAKWVAKLRELKMDDNILLFKTNMDAGHSGASGRFEILREIAVDYAFLLDLEGVKN